MNANKSPFLRVDLSQSFSLFNAFVRSQEKRRKKRLFIESRKQSMFIMATIEDSLCQM